jgi:hypothetical protein
MRPARAVLSEDDMLKVHMMLQAKGGVGKSTCAALLAQYLKDQRGRPALCLDTDPSNKTFTAWRSLGVKHIDIAVAGDLEKSRFDLVVAEIAGSDRDVVIDNGASGFIPITSYMAANDLGLVLEGMDREMVLHTVVVGGEAHRDTMDGLRFVARTFKASPVITWLNPMNGPIDRKAFDKELDAAGLAQRATVIELPDFGGSQATTFGRDFDAVLQAKQTFKDGRAARTSEIMVAHRLGMMGTRIFALLDDVLAANELA